MKTLLLSLSFLTGLFLSFAGPSQAQAQTKETLMISINHVVAEKDVNDFVKALVRTDANMGLCYFTATANYIPYAQDATIPYYGVAIVELLENCKPEARAEYLNWLRQEEAKGTYTIYSDAVVEPNPVIGGRN